MAYSYRARANVKDHALEHAINGAPILSLPNQGTTDERSVATDA
jgi:hypothetical protein